MAVVLVADPGVPFLCQHRIHRHRDRNRRTDPCPVSRPRGAAHFGPFRARLPSPQGRVVACRRRNPVKCFQLLFGRGTSVSRHPASENARCVWSMGLGRKFDFVRPISFASSDPDARICYQRPGLALVGQSISIHLVCTYPAWNRRAVRCWGYGGACVLKIHWQEQSELRRIRHAMRQPGNCLAARK